MERSVAIKKLRKLLGKNLGYRVDPKAPSAEERQAAQTALRIANDNKKQLGERLLARLEVLKADPEYQQIQAEYSVARKRADELLSTVSCYKITVGTANDLFFHVAAQGDSWEEVIRKVIQTQA